MSNNNGVWIWIGISEGLMWVAIGGAVAVGLLATHRAACLWALLIGLLNTRVWKSESK